MNRRRIFVYSILISCFLFYLGIGGVMIPNLTTPSTFAFSEGDGPDGQGQGGESGAGGGGADGGGGDVGPDADTAASDPDPDAQGPSSAASSGLGDAPSPGTDVGSGPSTDAPGSIGGPNDPGASTGASADTSSSESAGGLFGGFLDALEGLADFGLSAVSFAIDAVTPAPISFGFAASKGQTIGQSITGKSSIASDAVNGVVAAFSNDDSAQQGFEDAQGMFGGPTGNEPGEAGPTDPGSPEGEGPFFGGSAFPRSPLAPRIQFFADKLAVSRGESVTLEWNVSSANSCRALDSWVGEKDLEGKEILSNLENSGVYTLACSGASQSFRSRTVFITVLDHGVDVLPLLEDRPDLEKVIAEELAGLEQGQRLPKPVVTLEADTTTVAYGQPIRLMWNAQHALVCVGGDDWPRSQAVSASGKNYVATSGARVISFATNSTQFTLACFSADGQITRESVNVTVTSNTSSPGGNTSN